MKNILIINFSLNEKTHTIYCGTPGLIVTKEIKEFWFEKFMEAMEKIEHE